MNDSTALVLGLVVIAALGAGMYYYTTRTQVLTPGQQIGAGVGNLVGGILGAAGIQ